MTFAKEELQDIYDTGAELGIEESHTLIVSDGTMLRPADTGLPENHTLDMGRGFSIPDYGYGFEDFTDWEMAIVPLCSREGRVRDLITQAKLFSKADECVTLGFAGYMFQGDNWDEPVEWACRGIKMGLAES